MNANLTVPQLRALAREAGIPGRSRMRKAELIEALAQDEHYRATLARRVAAGVGFQPELVAPEGSPLRAAIAARNAYLEVVEGGSEIEAGAAWEDYLDACVAAGVCAQTYCWENATDGDGRCGRHSWGAPLGQDVVPTSEPEPVSRETVPSEPEQAAPISRGYTDCECRDCFDVTIGGSCCSLCEEAGCSDDGDQECYRDDAYQG